MKNRFWLGFWRLADPKISLASFAALFLGACAAAAQGKLDFLWLAVTVLGIFAIEIAKNASGEIFDFSSGNDQAVRPEDRSPFSGGKRVLMDELLTWNQTAGIAAFFYAVGAMAGISIVLWREPSLLSIGVLGIAIAFFYHAPPLKFSYRGLGELAVALSYGPLICAGTYLVQRGEITRIILVPSILLGLLIGLFLLINEFPDFHADKVANKRTLVVRYGRHQASWLYAGVMGLTAIATLALPFFGYSSTLWLGLIFLLPARTAILRIFKTPETTSEIIPAQANTLLAFLLFAFGTGVGFLLI